MWWTSDKYTVCMDKIKQVEDEVYPHPSLVFRALKMTKMKDVKVVIIGQDPYPQPGVADGLAFSVQPGVTINTTLGNILKELKEDVGITPPSMYNGSLTKWAKSGILLLNTSLTVTKNKRNSHAKFGWDGLVYEVVTQVAKRNPKAVFILWGEQAGKFRNAIGRHRDGDTSKVICSGHPSPLAVNTGGNFPGSKPFSQACRLLDEPYSLWSLRD